MERKKAANERKGQRGEWKGCDDCLILIGLVPTISDDLGCWEGEVKRK